MTDQLSLFAGPANVRTDLPAPVAAILAAARQVAFTTRMMRGTWGVRVGAKGRFELAGGCCCALGAYLVVSGATHERGDQSNVCAVARQLGVLDSDVYAFIDGFDGRRPDDGSVWHGYGRSVAEELKPA